MKISFIGFGNMAQAIAKNLSHRKEYQLSASDPSLTKGYRADGIYTSPDNLELVKDAELVILAVKPAKMEEVLTELKNHLAANCLVLSIAAGLSLDCLAKPLSAKQPIIRCMPNTPIAVGKGATLLIANSWVSKQQQEAVTTLFQHSGMVAWTEHEQDMDPFTAVAGSGPAYVFLFLEALIDSAKKLGFSEELAKKISLQTVAGALELVNNSELDISELRKKVTSPAGTTAAAIDILQQKGFNELLFDAMKAACERARELGS